MNTQLLVPIFMSLIRWGLALFGGGVAMESDDDITKAAGGLAALASIAWSIFDKYKTNKSK